MKVNEIRQHFIKYFEQNGHKLLSSSSLIPSNDPTLLFTNAGMVQFKDEFTGKSNPESKRAVTIQKCVRAGGKHNDLENVGFTARHHTFFEMMGNFSFGDYFKKEAIAFAWEFLTKELKLPKERLYVTAHHTDQEAADIWHEQEGVPREHIFFRGDKDNFWEMGEVGPCGPCSEIFFDHGEETSDPNADTSECILDDEDRYVEIWNLVFMQFEKYKEDGVIKKRNLPKPCVDTGSGLERVAAAMQKVYNNFDTDLFAGLIQKIEELSNKKYQNYPQWMRVVADHARSATMLLADGVIPSNEGRGYVLRRIIRRAVRYLDLLEVSKTSFYELTPIVFDSLGELYEESRKNMDFIQKYLRLEEDGFRKTLASGLKLLEKKIQELEEKKKTTLSGKDAFLLYDTHGFPVDLTEMILREKNLFLNNEEFEKEMQAQKERSKKAGDFSAKEDNLKAFYKVKESSGESHFIGYDHTESKATLVAKIDLGDKISLIFDQTPFYAEGGGQQGDRGEILDEDNIVALVEDTNSPIEGMISHVSTTTSELTVGKKYQLKVDKRARTLTMCNHTATHLLQAALINVLGSHVKQAGSNVGPKRLRFDFTHPEAMTKDQIKKVEKLVNFQIQKQTAVTPEVMSKDLAMQKGAMALFGEKYGNEVRVIDIPGFSIELCGGTHVKNTADIGYFKIISEGSLASGTRRIEAATNVGAYEYVDEKLSTLEELEGSLNAKGERLISKVDQLKESLQVSQKEVKNLKDKMQAASAQSMFEDTIETKDGFTFKHIEAKQEDDIRKIGDLFMDKFSNGVVLITQPKGDKLGALLKTSKKNKSFNCSELLKESLSSHGGRGGGKPDMAQGSLELIAKDKFIKELKEKILS